MASQQEEQRWSNQDQFNNQTSRDIGSILATVENLSKSFFSFVAEQRAYHTENQMRMDKIVEEVRKDGGSYVKKNEYEQDKQTHDKRLEEVETWKADVRDKFIKWGAYFGVIGVIVQTIFFYILLPNLKDFWAFITRQ